MRLYEIGRSAIVVTAVSLATLAAAGIAQSARVIDRQPGISLLKQVRSDDSLIAVRGGLGRPSAEFITLPGYIGLMVGGSAAGVVLDVTAANGRLTEDESWVVTDIQGSVKRVLYTRKGKIDAGEQVSMTFQRGGETKVGSVTMRAGVVPKVMPGRSYLVFLNRTHELFVPPVDFRDRDTNEWYPSVGLFEITRKERIIDPARYCVPVPDEYFPELILHNSRTDLVLNLIQEAVRELK